MEENTGLVARPREWLSTTQEFVRDTTAEMKKVTWPNRNEVVNTTVVVLVATVIFAVYLWGCDVVFYKAIDLLFSRFGASTNA
jgi:preprotein translocase subunit SecE